MITYSIIQKSQLEGAYRLDAEYYQPEYLDLLTQIKDFEIKNLKEISDILRGNTPKEYGDYDTPVIRSGDLSHEFINDEENLLKAKKENVFFVQKNDILISSIGFGSIGKVNIFTGQNNNFGTVAEVSVIRNPKLNPFYLWAFLKSKFGQFQINREITGATGQLHLNTGNIENILIPIINTQEFEYLYKEIEKYYQNSKSFYSQAENLLLEELGLKDFKNEEDLFSIVNLSEVKNANRIDAEYFQPKYNRLFLQLKKYDAQRLGELVTLKKGFEPGSEAYQEEGKLFIRVSSLSKNGITDKDQKYLSDDLYKKLKKDYEPKVGEILLTKDATPGIAYALKEPIEGIIAGGILRLKLKEDIEPGYLTLCINSLVGQMQAERDAGGSIIAHWKPEQIKNLLIPILSKPIQQKIAELVQKSHEARSKAKQLLEQAKSKVEGLIESK
ncbi:MAG: restriction endonuclease subunit S [Candidatus Giovannonibacteria bacterium]|nr:MAG: restriction endonuclease subunit S [Candidatus Giovannonibacteria bacterium]